jgi:hypothetical protein
MQRRRPLIAATETTARLAESLDDLERWLTSYAAAPG